MINNIILTDVTKQIKNTTILDNINLKFEGGKIYGICGRNGSGKTMLLRAISGLIKLSKGKVIINGEILYQDIDYPPSIGVLIENPEFWKNYTGYQVLKTLASIKNVVTEEEIIRALLRVGLEPKDNRTMKKYSLGMKQRLGIAQAIMENPDIILLDEPTNTLDASGVELVNLLVAEEAQRGAIIIIASHDADELSKCHEIIRIENGKVVEVRRNYEY